WLNGTTKEEENAQSKASTLTPTSSIAPFQSTPTRLSSFGENVSTQSTKLNIVSEWLDKNNLSDEEHRLEHLTNNSTASTTNTDNMTLQWANESFKNAAESFLQELRQNMQGNNDTIDASAIESIGNLSLINTNRFDLDQ